MTDSQLIEHGGYLADERKIRAYRDALAEVVRPGDVVLDIGAGTGLLGLLACEAGAGQVVAIDRGDIIDLARRIAADNGWADRITHLQRYSTSIELDTPGDVAVCDQIGGLVHDAGILACFADARRRLLVPDAPLVPASFTVHAAPVTFERARETIEFWSSRPSGIDVSAARTHAVNSEWHYTLGPDSLTRLAAAADLAEFAADDERPVSGTADYVVGQAGRLDGHLGWFTAQMSPSVTLTNDPWSADRFERWCNFYPLDRAVDVVEGDRVRFELDVRPRLGIVSWATTVCPAQGERHTERASTFRGSFLAGATVADVAKDERVPATGRTELVRAAVELVDGERTQAGIVAALEDEVGRTVATRDQLERFVRGLASFLRG